MGGIVRSKGGGTPAIGTGTVLIPQSMDSERQKYAPANHRNHLRKPTKNRSIVQCGGAGQIIEELQTSNRIQQMQLRQKQPLPWGTFSSHAG